MTSLPHLAGGPFRPVSLINNQWAFFPRAPTQPVLAIPLVRSWTLTVADMSLEAETDRLVLPVWLLATGMQTMPLESYCLFDRLCRSRRSVERFISEENKQTHQSSPSLSTSPAYCSLRDSFTPVSRCFALWNTHHALW